jgi:phosphatidylglycerol:prolipoprotein diacylglycerol transferase
MLTWNFEPEIISGLPIRWYGVMFAAMLMIAFQAWRWQILRAGKTDEESESFLMAGVIAVIAGSRLGHCLFYEPEKYLRHPLEILKVWEGGLASHGGTLGLLLALLWWSRKYKMQFIEVLDRFSFSAAIGVIFVRLANFTNSEIVGRITDPESAPFAVKFVRSIEDRAKANLQTGDFSQVPGVTRRSSTRAPSAWSCSACCTPWTASSASIAAAVSSATRSCSCTSADAA